MSDDTPMEAGPLPLSPHDERHEAMVIRNRRLMRREYSKNYGHEPVTFVPQPTPEPPPIPMPSDLTNNPMSFFWRGVIAGFLLTLGIVAGATAFLLFKVL